MKKNKLIISLLILTIIFQSCIKPEFVVLPDSVIESVDDLIIPEGFDWKTTQTLSVSVVLPNDGDIKPLTITNGDATIRYFRGYPDDGSRIVNTKITVPSYIKELKISYDSANESNVDLISNSSLSYDFNTSNKSARKNAVSAIDLGLIANFTLYTAVGALANTGQSDITGDIGTNNGAITGYGGTTGGTTVHNGDVHNANIITQNAIADLSALVTLLTNRAATKPAHAPAFGNETLSPGVYEFVGAASITAATTLTLDGEGNPDALFIFKVAGAFTTGANATVVLINGASQENVFWLSSGAIALATGTTMSGNLISNPGAVSMAAGGKLNGRMLSTTGAVSTDQVTFFIQEQNSVELISKCDDVNPDVIFTITNIGSDMTTDQEYTLFKNNEQVDSGTYQLDADETLEVTSAAITDEIFKLVITTPNGSTLEETIQGCGDFPSEQYGGSLAFEDLYPAKGDADFNDLVLDYDFKIVKDNQEIVQSITATILIKAFGASTRSGFGFTLPTVDPSAITSVTGYDVTNSTVFNIGNNGLEIGQSKATIIVFDDVFRVMPTTGGGTGANTESARGYTQPRTIVVEIDFNESVAPMTFSDLNIGATFNPFMIVGTTVDGAPGTRGKEIHLPQNKPSDLFDTTYFQQLNDDSSVANNKYFLSADNLPWAIHTAGKFDWVIEFEDITKAYLKFGSWAESNGNIDAAWYNDKSNGFRADALIYVPN
jgi:LruC domain-containing protein